MRRRIDVHTHHYPPGYFDAIATRIFSGTALALLNNV